MRNALKIPQVYKWEENERMKNEQNFVMNEIVAAPEQGVK